MELVIIIGILVGYLLSYYSEEFFGVDIPSGVFYLFFGISVVIFCLGIVFIGPNFWSNFPNILTERTLLFIAGLVIGIILDLLIKNI